MSALILKRAPIGSNQDDLEDGVVVGRSFLSPVAPEDRPWMWASGHNGDIRRAAYGYEPTREAAMAAFAKSRRIAVRWTNGCDGIPERSCRQRGAWQAESAPKAGGRGCGPCGPPVTPASPQKRAAVHFPRRDLVARFNQFERI
jgi:hypothetical protein